MSKYDFSTAKTVVMSESWIPPEPWLKTLGESSQPHTPSSIDPWQPLRHWLASIDVKRRERAYFICKTIPSRCPFERDIQWFGKTVLRIPPLCRINPLYDDIVALRFRALCYLADECGEDVTQYC